MTEPVDSDAVRVTAQGVRWLVVPEFAEAVEKLDLRAARRPERSDAAELVKDSTTRSVIRLPDPLEPEGPGIYLKRDKFRDWQDSARHLVVPTKAHVEWRMSRALRRAGIPTCRVPAIGLRRRCLLPVEGFVVSREIVGAVPLGELLEEGTEGLEAAHPGYRRELREELAGLTARLLGAGFHHRDYHVGNILVRPEAPAGERLFVLDLHSVRRRRPSRRRVRGMLTMLAHSVHNRGVGDEERAEFLRSFLRRWDGGSESAAEDWLRELRSSKRRFRRRHVRSRTKRCLKESSLFTGEAWDRFRVHRRRSFPREAALEAVRRHRQRVAGGRDDVRVFRDGGQGGRTELSLVECAELPPCEGGQPARPEERRRGRVCVKAFRRDRWADRLKDVFRPRSRARAAWVAHRLFRAADLPAPAPLALLEARGRLAGRPDYLIVEAVENDGDLHEYVTTHELSPGERTALGRAVAKVLDRLGREEIYHPDTKPTNFLVREREGGYGLWLVDLDRARHGRPLSKRQWAKCLARLDAGLPGRVTLLDRMRCLRRLSKGRWSARERLRMARRVRRMSLARGPKW